MATKKILSKGNSAWICLKVFDSLTPIGERTVKFYSSFIFQGKTVN